jgi:hypothetical protein
MNEATPWSWDWSRTTLDFFASVHRFLSIVVLNVAAQDLKD